MDKAFFIGECKGGYMNLFEFDVLMKMCIVGIGVPLSVSGIIGSIFPSIVKNIAYWVLNATILRIQLAGLIIFIIGFLVLGTGL